MPFIDNRYIKCRPIWIMSIRRNEKEEKSLEQAQKEAEIVSESAKDTRLDYLRSQREAKTRANKYVYKHEERQADRNSISSSTEQQEQAIENVLDKTKDEIKVATREAAKEIPQYTQKLGDLQEQTILTTREIADNYIESQKEIISIYQSVWTPFVENANSRFWNYWSISPKGMAETYGTVVSSYADNVIAATRLTNNAVSANMELFSTALQRTKDNSRELSRLEVNAAKVFHEATNDVTTARFYAAETVPSSRPRR